MDPGVRRDDEQARGAQAPSPARGTLPLQQRVPHLRPSGHAEDGVAAGPRITPAARAHAHALGIDPAQLRPDPHGVIGLREVEAAAAAAPPAPRSAPDLDAMRRAIAAAMQHAWREIPHYHVTSVLDVSILMRWLDHHNAGLPLPQRLVYAVPLIKAIALALRATPALNGHFVDDAFVPATEVNLGIAISLRGGGLIAPAILAADTLDLPILMTRLDDLVARVRGGRLRSSEMSAATATLSNLGEHSADMLQPVIHPPQVAIVGCGQIVERAWAQDGALSARPTLTITVAGDHRVSDGRSAAAFIGRVDALLRAPEEL